MELTKEHFDQTIKGLATKDDLQTSVAPLATKKQILATQEQIEELARMTKNGFEDVLERLDFKERIQKLEKQMAEMRTALHLSS